MTRAESAKGRVMPYHFHCWDLANLAYPPRVRWEEAGWIEDVYDSVQLNAGFTPQFITGQPGLHDWLTRTRCGIVQYQQTGGDVSKTQQALLEQRINRFVPMGLMLDSESHSLALDLIHRQIGLAEGLPWWTDPPHHLGQFDEAAKVSAWAIVQGGLDGHPLKVAQYTQLCHAHRRISCPAADVWVGPHLGYDGYRVGDQRYRRPTPPDVLTMGLWLSLACGAQGAPLWGQQCLLPPLDPTHPAETWIGISGALPPPVYFPEEGQRVYRQLKDFRATTAKLGGLTDRWRPKPARIGVLYPDVHPADQAGIPRRNMHWAALMLGEPCEVVFLSDFVRGYTDHIEVILVTWDLDDGTLEVDSVKRWLAKGGRIVEPKDVGPLTWTVATANAQAHQTELYNLCDRLADMVGRESDGLWVTTRLTDGADEYLTVVNAAIAEGPECEWWANLSGQRVLLDKGCPLLWTNDSGDWLYDVLKKQLIGPGKAVLVPAGAGLILQKVRFSVEEFIERAKASVLAERRNDVIIRATEAIIGESAVLTRDIVAAAVAAQLAVEDAT